MTALSIISVLLMTVYLVTMYVRHGMPDMVSDTYYQLGKRGWIFSAVLALVAVTMLVPVLDSGRGAQCLAFIGLVAFLFVGTAPNYVARDEYKIHKSSAITAAAGCIGWSITVNWIPTATIVALYALYYAFTLVRKSKAHPWYWAEVAAMADTYITYYISI